MREIKFRVKDFNNKWHITDGIYRKKYNGDKWFAEIYPTLDDDRVRIVVKRDTLGQYTGLKDKNGVEIYEGDIVKSKYWNGVISWVDKLDAIGWYVMEQDEYGDNPQAFDKDSAEELFEVIGNIHEGVRNE